mmetsp:Transcript_3502/g.9484  ORF Transcript_3502/g.9484 Transcript_3502/m.9484 type:complete len:118 (+) Transcript_3502:81-434(+)
MAVRLFAGRSPGYMWYSSASNQFVLSKERKNKLLYRSHQRGTRENSVLLGAYAKKKLECMTEPQVEEFEMVLNEQDPELFKWITGKEPLPPNKTNDTVLDIKQFVTEHGHLNVDLYR